MEDSHFLSKVMEIIQTHRGNPLSVEGRREAAIELASLMMNEARRIQPYSEKKAQENLAKIIDDPNGKNFLLDLTDQCFRPKSSARVGDQLLYLLEKNGPPNFLSMSQRFALGSFTRFGHKLSSVSVPMIKKVVRDQFSHIVFPADKNRLRQHLQQRKSEKATVNINYLGEAVLGEEDAKRRLEIYLDYLRDPDVEYISIKPSSICSQINLISREHTLEILAERLRTLFRAAKEHGKDKPKFINLDMEEYRDLHLTVALFRRVLEEPEFYHTPAGIALQAYLPDSYIIQQELTLWAVQRVAGGGEPIHIRLVKGANLPIEQIEAALHNWPQAPYSHKVDSDANFKRMVHYGCQSEHAKAAHIGIGSHNLFDIAYAMLLRAENLVEEYVSFEMLEGMADSIRRVVQKLSKNMILYCPVTSEQHFQYAISYLIRRLDENTAPENFLRHMFDLIPGSRDWQHQASLFSLSCHAANSVTFKPRKNQNRLIEDTSYQPGKSFVNCSDTDWSLPHNYKWVDEILRRWKERAFEEIPLVIGGKEIREQSLAKGNICDPSNPQKVLCSYHLADEKLAGSAVETAVKASEKWQETSLEERDEIFTKIVQAFHSHRGDLIGSMTAGEGKTIHQGDVEVSEAIDFIEYYRLQLQELDKFSDLSFQSKGPILIAPPWNFPCSIPTGCIAASLLTGNSVIFKPAPEAVLTGWELVNLFWKCGIDKELLQFVTCEDDPVGTSLIKDERIQKVVFTGGTETAKIFLRTRPGIDLIAETGGKNALIITAMADRDLAIKDAVQSAFGHSGQKCSACSLLVLEKEVYNDLNFRNQLVDAVKSLYVGSAWLPQTIISPLINPPGEVLERGLTQLEEGEEWALQPVLDEENPQLWSPGIKYGVRSGSFTHQTELFGPVLGVMCADNLEKAIEIVNATPYGLTSGIHTLDDREKELWKEKIVAGNAYINRGITGAIVQRQPFGGCKESNFGTGAKTGGPNYLFPFYTVRQETLPEETGVIPPAVSSLNCFMEDRLSGEDLKLWRSSLSSYAYHWEKYFSKAHDPSSILGEDNLLSYRPRSNLLLRAQAEDSEMDILRVAAACLTAEVDLEISLPSGKLEEVIGLDWWKNLPSIRTVVEEEGKLIRRLEERGQRRVRLLSNPSIELERALGETACRINRKPLLANGRLELLNYLREFSLSHDYHRYGNIRE